MGDNPTPMNLGGNQQWWINQSYYQPQTLGGEENLLKTMPSPFEMWNVESWKLKKTQKTNIWIRTLGN